MNMATKVKAPTVPTLIREYVDKGINAQRRYADQLFKQAKERVDALAKRAEGADDQIYHLTQRAESAEETGARIDAEMEALRATLSTAPGPSNVKIEAAAPTVYPAQETIRSATQDYPSIPVKCEDLSKEILRLIIKFHEDTGLMAIAMNVERFRNGWALRPVFVIPPKENLR